MIKEEGGGFVQPILQYDVAYPERLSRGLIFVKWLLVIPHLVVLTLLFFVVAFVTVIAWFAILITGNYPRSLWEFTMMTLRWSARANVYGVSLQRDEYPPFGDGDYPVLFQLDYPESLSRWRIFVKPILVIPHLVIIYFLRLAQAFVHVIAFFAILFTGAYPRGMFDFASGVSRWQQRASVYVYLLTDAYPPFTLDRVASPTSAAVGYQVGGGGGEGVARW